MRLETFLGTDSQSVFAQARAVLGDDAMVLRMSTVMDGGRRMIEMVAASAEEVERVRRKLRVDPPFMLEDRNERGPLIVALVGPTGAGKTTTIAKLAVNLDAFGTRRAGVLALDTYRVGGLEQLQTYAEIAQLPVEVIYDIREVGPALARLADCDVVLVDTPGRSPKAHQLNAEWQELLRVIGPHEVHLVMPATIRHDIALTVRDTFGATGPTHLLLTKLDEVPQETGVAELALKLDLPARWITDGQDVPNDLKPAGARLLGSLGLIAGDSTDARRPSLDATLVLA